jgi:hypothetical protein
MQIYAVSCKCDCQSSSSDRGPVKKVKNNIQSIEASLRLKALFYVIVIGFIETDDNPVFFAGKLKKKEQRVQPVN